MSKYKPLSDHLSSHPADEWRASFAEVEEVLGFPLPKTARGSATWWSNGAGRGASVAWTGAGWSVADLDRAGESVTFRRLTSSVEPAPSIAAASKLRKVGPFAAGVAVAAGVAALVARQLRKRGARPG